MIASNLRVPVLFIQQLCKNNNRFDSQKKMKKKFNGTVMMRKSHWMLAKCLVLLRSWLMAAAVVIVWLEELCNSDSFTLSMGCIMVPIQQRYGMPEQRWERFDSLALKWERKRAQQWDKTFGINWHNNPPDETKGWAFFVALIHNAKETNFKAKQSENFPLIIPSSFRRLLPIHSEHNEK